MKAKIAVLSATALLLIGTSIASRSADAQTLTVGNYHVSAYVSSYQVTYGNWCFPVTLDPLNNYVASFGIRYNGPGQTTYAVIAVPYIPNGGNVYGPYVVRLTMQPFPATGTQWSGLYSEEVEQPGKATGSLGASTLTATLNVMDAQTFAGTMTLTGFSPGWSNNQQVSPNLCNITLQYAAYYVGP